MTVRQRQFTSVHHTNQADTFRNVVIRMGIFFPAASHPEIALHACAGRLLVMEHEVKSLKFKERLTVI
jgi:hypothetical protein